MPNLPLPAAAMALLMANAGSAPAGAPEDAFPPPQYQVAQLIVQQQIVIRVQRPGARVRSIRRQSTWIEKKGPKCVALDGLAGALILQPDAVDLVLEGGERVRARLDDDCPALDFYAGFYLKPTKDGKVCAGRDFGPFAFGPHMRDRQFPQAGRETLNDIPSMPPQFETARLIDFSGILRERASVTAARPSRGPYFRTPA